MTHAVVFLLDVDNTLLDNDRVIDDLRGHLVQAIGSPSADRYWALFEQLRIELGYADYLGALQRFRVEALDEATPDPVLLQLSGYLIDYPFADRLYPGALRAIEHLRRFGLTAILRDGDVAFQPRKVQRSGLWRAVEGRVMIYIHKERMLDAVQTALPVAARRDGGRQAALVGGDETNPGRASDNGVHTPGPLRLRPAAHRKLPARRHHAAVHRRPGQCRLA